MESTDLTKKPTGGLDEEEGEVKEVFDRYGTA